jgi:hypothetical protein
MSKKSKTYWNTRVVFDPKTNTLGFKEVHYKNGKIKMWTEDFIQAKEIFKKHLKFALSEPILKQNKKSLKSI